MVILPYSVSLFLPQRRGDSVLVGLAAPGCSQAIFDADEKGSFQLGRVSALTPFCLRQGVMRCVTKLHLGTALS